MEREGSIWSKGRPVTVKADASCVAHAWADGDLINIKCACFSTGTDE